ncbi:MAG TPA: AAA family ATPase [Crinalium sp.]
MNVHSAIAPHLLILIGLPGSGKSTLATHLSTANPARLLISTDTIRAKLFGDEATQGPWPLIWAELQQQFQTTAVQILHGAAQDAIYDATNVVRKQRRQVMALARSCGFKNLAGVWLDVPLEICLERNQKRDRQVPTSVIHHMHRCLRGAPPSLQEDFQSLIHYTHFEEGM